MKSNEEFKNILYNESKKINLELSDEKLEKFAIYKDLLLEWNEKMNLTAITDEYEVIMKHFIDCLELVKYIKSGEKVIDVGTGAGFPGVVIAIYFDNIQITLMDALNKRLIFLSEVVEKLGLKNVNIVHGRAEEMAHNPEYREFYDVVVSRAVAALNVLLEFDSAYIKVGGRCLLLKGDNVDEELSNSKNSLKILNLKYIKKYTYNYFVSDEEYIRNIVEIKKVQNTSNKYPRIFGKIKKQPL